MNEIEILKQIASKKSLTNADRATLKEIAERHGETVPACKCKDKFLDLAVILYHKLSKSTENAPLPKAVKFVFVGFAPVRDSHFGILSDITSEAVLRQLYAENRRLFDTLYKIEGA